MITIAAIACFFFCADKAYQWFYTERKHRISIYYTERSQKIEREAAESLDKMGTGVESLAKRHGR